MRLIISSKSIPLTLSKDSNKKAPKAQVKVVKVVEFKDSLNW